MDIDKVINDRVMLILREVDGLRAAGLYEHNFYAKVVGRDHIGLWIENPKFEITRVRREDGTIIRQHPDPLGQCALYCPFSPAQWV